MNGVFLIPIFAIVFGIGMGMLGLWTDHKRKSQMLEHQHRERMAAIEKGVTLPPTSQDAANSRDVIETVNPARVLRTGVCLLSLGIVLYFALDTVGASQAAVFGLVPATLGLANLAYAMVLFNREKKAAEEKRLDRQPPS